MIDIQQNRGSFPRAKYKDLGDGSFAEVIALEPSSISGGGAVDVSDRSARLLGHTTVDNASLSVTGTFWQATQPVSGIFWQTTQPVSIASMPSTPVTGTFWQATQPVSGTLTVNQGTIVSATLVGTTISAANTTVTLTLNAVAAQFHYITSIEIVGLNPTVTAIAAAATNLAFTSTNINGIAWNAGTLLAAGAEKVVTRMQFGPPLRSVVANTNTTIVAPPIGTGGLVRITVTYYTAT